MRRVLRCFATTLLLASITGCSPQPSPPNLQEIYARVAEAKPGADESLLITVPGTLGSRLVDGPTGTVIWGGGSAGISADPDNSDEARLIALPIVPESTPFSAHRNTVVPAGILDVAPVEVFGIPVPVEVYGGVRRTLSVGGFRTATIDQGDRTTFARAGPEGEDDRSRIGAELLGNPAPSSEVSAAEYDQLSEEPANAFRFDYDWRRDLPSLAAEFHRFVVSRQRDLAAKRSLQSGLTVRPEDIRFDILAHSMGGLITRYYLMYGTQDLGEDGALPEITWEGAKNFGRVIFVAPPNAGSIIAMENLVNGKELGPFQPTYPPELLATHPAIWQLMPRTRHNAVTFDDLPDGSEAPVDIYNPDLWQRYGWGLAATDADPLLEWLLPEIDDPVERRLMALRHQARMLRRAERFHAAMDRWSPPPPHIELYLVVGGGFATPATAKINRKTGVLRIASAEEGDGVVLRSSVLLDERQGGSFSRGLISPLRFNTVLFLPDEHVELTKNAVFGDNLLFWLLEQPRSRESLRTANVPQSLLPSTGSAPARRAPVSPGAASVSIPKPGNER